MKRFTALAIPICLLIALTNCVTSEPTPTPTPSPSPTQEQLTVHFIDVGQGDSILIDLGETEVLIDAGYGTNGGSYSNSREDRQRHLSACFRFISLTDCLIQTTEVRSVALIEVTNTQNVKPGDNRP